MFIQSTSHFETQGSSDQRGDIGSLHHHGSAHGKVCPPDPHPHARFAHHKGFHKKKKFAIIDLYKLSNLLSRRRRRQDELQPGLRSATATTTTVTTVRVGRFDNDDVDKDGLVRLQIERRPRRGDSDSGETGGGGASSSLFLQVVRL